MKISSLDEYGLRCMLQLARLGPDGSTTIPEIAEREGLTVAYVGKLMGLLRQAGMVQSARGRQGGYRLARPASEIAVADLLRSLGGTTWERGGCDRFHGVHEVCVHNSSCTILSLWGALDQVVEQLLGNVTLGDLVSGERFTAERLCALEARASAQGQAQLFRRFGRTPDAPDKIEV